MVVRVEVLLVMGNLADKPVMMMLNLDNRGCQQQPYQQDEPYFSECVKHKDVLPLHFSVHGSGTFKSTG